VTPGDDTHDSPGVTNIFVNFEKLQKKKLLTEKNQKNSKKSKWCPGEMIREQKLKSLKTCDIVPLTNGTVNCVTAPVSPGLCESVKAFRNGFYQA
jgi:hypothetical protein